MSTASVSYIEFDASEASLKDNVTKIVKAGRANGHKFATYIPVDGPTGKAVTVVLHEANSANAKGAELVELHTRQDTKAGLSVLANGTKYGISKFKSRTAHITHHGEACEAKPYAIAFLVSYDKKHAADLKRAGHAITAHNPSFRFHVVRREGVAGNAAVVVPVDSLDELDKPVSAKAKPIVDLISKAVNSVSVIKLKRLADYSN
jgi:hypothetical protein